MVQLKFEGYIINRLLDRLIKCKYSKNSATVLYYLIPLPKDESRFYTFFEKSLENINFVAIGYPLFVVVTTPQNHVLALRVPKFKVF